MIPTLGPTGPHHHWVSVVSGCRWASCIDIFYCFSALHFTDSLWLLFASLCWLWALLIVLFNMRLIEIFSCFLEIGLYCYKRPSLEPLLQHLIHFWKDVSFSFVFRYFLISSLIPSLTFFFFLVACCLFSMSLCFSHLSLCKIFRFIPACFF